MVKKGWTESKAREELIRRIDEMIGEVSAEAKIIEDRTNVLDVNGKDRDDWLRKMGVINGLGAAREIIKYGVTYLE